VPPPGGAEAQRRRVERALMESRALLAQAEQLAQMGHWTYDLRSQQIHWSDEVFRIFEFEQRPGGPRLDAFLRAVHPEERAWVRQTFEDALRNRNRFSIVHRLRMPDGRIKHVEASGECIYTREGKPVRSIGTVKDVTERTRTEQESREMIRALHALHAVSVLLDQPDLEGELLLAAIVEELPGILLVAPQARAILEVDGVSRAAGQAGDLVERITVPILVSGRAVGQLVLGYVGICPIHPEGPFSQREREAVASVARSLGISLTAREAMRDLRRLNAGLEEGIRQRTAELDRREGQVRALLNAIPDMVVRMNTGGVVLDRRHGPDSAALAVLIGRGTERVSADAGHPLLAACLDIGRRAVAGNWTLSEELEVPGPTGRVPVELRASGLGADEFVVFVRDIAARKRLEAETAGMLKREREVSEMKTRFLSVASHEFRTPMSVVMGSLELLRTFHDRLTGPKRDELFNRITDAMQRMNGMLEEVLTLSRADSGRQKAELGTLNLEEFVRVMVDELRLADHEAHPLEVTVEGDVTRFVTDQAALRHIVSNLVSNALRYSPAGEPVTIRVRAEAWRVLLDVEDRGIGIPEADRGRVFEAFERGSNVGPIKGTGLGLNIVKRMAELLGGNVSVDSAPGRGSRFTVELPRLVGT
jgi:PAS domain S-box-containing protein